MKGSLTIGKIFGVKIEIHWTFLILVAWIFLAGRSIQESVWALAFIGTVFICVVLHELGHALAARRYGISTRSITLLPIGGVAQLSRIPDKPLQELVVAIAGPLVNIAIAAVLLLPMSHLLNRHGLAGLMEAINGENFLMNLFMINLSLALFNLIPAFPMDGGRILRAVLNLKLSKIQATRIAARFGQVLAVGFIILFITSSQIANTSPSLLLIAIFVFFGAQAELKGTVIASLLDNHAVSEATIRDFGRLDVDDGVEKAVGLLLNSSHHEFVIFDDGSPVGTLGRSGLLRALREKGSSSRVRDVMNTDMNVIQSDAPLTDALERLQNGSPDQPLLVARRNRVEGIINTDNVLEFIMMRRK